MVRRNSLKILGCTYDIKYSQDLHVENDGGRNIAGQVFHEEQRISIQESHPEHMQDTLLHEVLHAMMYAMNIDGGNVDDEDMVKGISRGLLAVMRDNGWSPVESLAEPKKRAKKRAK